MSQALTSRPEVLRDEAGLSPEEEGDCLIMSLPNELLMSIFSFLPLADLKHRVALTCRRWYHLSTSRSFILDLVFGPKQPTQDVLRVLQYATHLKYVTFFSRHDVNELMKELTTSNTKLVGLKISTRPECRHIEVDSEILLDLLRATKDLKYLCLKRVTFDDPRLVFSELGYAAPKLVSLSLNHSSQVDTQRLHRLVIGLPKLRDLRINSISYNNIGSQTPYTDAPVVELLTRMGDSLEVLKLNMMGLSGAIMPLLATAARVSTLHLYRATGIEDEAFIQLARLTLRELVVTVPRAISGGCFADLLGSPSLSGLRVLTISNSYSLDDAALGTLSGNCPHLEELSLPGCRRVTAHGLTSVLASCPGLLRLNLFSVRASVSAAFLMIPDYVPNLQLLVYKPVDRVSSDVPPELLAMPNLVIKSVYRYQ